MSNNFGRSVATPLLIFIFLVCVHANPIVIRSSVVKKEGQQEDAKQFDGSRVQGIANFEGDAGFNKLNENKLVSSANLGRYGETAGNRKDHLNEGQFDKGSFFQQGGGQVADNQNKVAHNKGHRKSGFHNSYHKDETGSNSSFFDDGSDEGGAYVHKSHKGAYGDGAQKANRGGDLDAAHFDNQRAQRGEYDNAERHQKDLGNHQNFNRKQYLDDREASNRRTAANHYGDERRYQEDQMMHRPYHHPMPAYYDGYDRPYGGPRKHITIYEDPRYASRAAPYRQYDDDYIELDVRPLREDMRYQYRRPVYDYNY